uniref:Uncharacterized protein n=1 Tax=Rhipicephalus zambeziensis TaxID=60191 RepID=A0A224YHE5_9ACAR
MSFTDLYIVLKECQRSLVGIVDCANVQQIKKKKNLHCSKLRLPNKECGKRQEVIPNGNLRMNASYCNVTMVMCCLKRNQALEKKFSGMPHISVWSSLTCLVCKYPEKLPMA